MTPYIPEVILLLAAGVLLRWCISLNPYSGQGKPPMFGDYEAQRHWMEITYNLPVKEWYFNGTNNDLQYWGLDYPPLTAYHSYLLGYMAHHINSSWVELYSSRGTESPQSKLFMRYSVLITDLLIYFPAVLAFASTISPKIKRVQAVVALTVYPGLLLIDYGHFQYNCVSLGLALLGIACLNARRDLLGSIAFVLALNYKQMELYHAMPFFSYLLGSAFRNRENSTFKLLKLGVVVIVTFGACWWPFIQNKETAFQVLQRLFPFKRGIFEDKVANFWCSISVALKLKNIFSIDQLIKICLFSTGLLLVPSSLSLVWRPNIGKFKIALVNASLVFFLFSFQVHEKSILLCALPICALLPEEPFMCLWFLLISTFSMLPLLVKDGLLLPAFASCLLFLCLMSLVCDDGSYHALTGSHLLQSSSKSSKPLIPSSLHKSVFAISLLGCVSLAIASVTVNPPPHLPDLFPVLVSVYCCAHFLLFLLYFHYMQFSWIQPCDGSSPPTRPSQKPNVYSKYTSKKKH